MKQIYQRPETLKDVSTHFCPGCGHSIIHRILAEVLEELDMVGKTLGVAPAGCAVMPYKYLKLDLIESAHGRGCAVATGLKRCLPDRLVFSYQGDGDLAAIGTAETIHSAARGENFTVIFVNNGIYGMTGGQMAPTTLPGMKATTAPFGREAHREGFPLNMSHLVAQLPGVAYVNRVMVTQPKTINKAKRALKEAFKCQMAGEGFSLVEFLSPCPTNWKMNPLDSCQYVESAMSDYFEPGILLDRRVESKKKSAKKAAPVEA